MELKKQENSAETLEVNNKKGHFLRNGLFIFI